MDYADAVNTLSMNTDCHEDMAGLMDKLRSLKHNISGVIEPTQQIYNKFVIEESLKWVEMVLSDLSIIANLSELPRPETALNGRRLFVTKNVHAKRMQWLGANI